MKNDNWPSGIRESPSPGEQADDGASFAHEPPPGRIGEMSEFGAKSRSVALNMPVELSIAADHSNKIYMTETQNVIARVLEAAPARAKLMDATVGIIRR